MKKSLMFLMLLSISANALAAKKEKIVDCPGKMWTTKEECKRDEGNWILNDKDCEKSYLGNKASADQVCCGACTEDSIEPGVD